MTVAVVIPLSRELDAHRARAWQWIRGRYQVEHPGWEIVPGYCDGPWIKAVAVEDALSRTDADVLVIADCDCWSSDLSRYVELVAAGERDWAVPHLLVARLNEQGTHRVIANGIPADWPRDRDFQQRPYDGMVGGGIVILTRDLYEQVPLDCRFVGWGGEDQSFGWALKTMNRRHARGSLPLWHLFHEPQERLTRKVGNEVNEALTLRYRAALGDVDAMELLLGEARCCRTSSSVTSRSSPPR